MKDFLYKEETDLIKRCNDNKIECFMLRDVLINHIGTDSLDTKKSHPWRVIHLDIGIGVGQIFIFIKNILALFLR